ncbi:MAG: twin-arginine translocation signal domain-containing protein [Nocardioidaceae bacterium]
MSDNTVTNMPRPTRRSLIGGLTLGTAAVVAETVRPSPANAADGDPVLAGELTTATSLTTLYNTGDAATTSGNALEVGGANFGGSGLAAYSFGGESPAVFAQGIGNGVTGRTFNSGASGVYGQNDGGGFGVAGRSNQTNGTGVFGEALGAGGTALRGLSSDGTALKVEGKAEFSRSGAKRIPAGTLKVAVPLPGVTAHSLILATLQKTREGLQRGRRSARGRVLHSVAQPARARRRLICRVVRHQLRLCRENDLLGSRNRRMRCSDPTAR